METSRNMQADLRSISAMAAEIYRVLDNNMPPQAVEPTVEHNDSHANSNNISDTDECEDY
jgi:hypothetical protein